MNAETGLTKESVDVKLGLEYVVNLQREAAGDMRHNEQAFNSLLALYFAVLFGLTVLIKYLHEVEDPNVARAVVLFPVRFIPIALTLAMVDRAWRASAAKIKNDLYKGFMVSMIKKSPLGSVVFIEEFPESIRAKSRLHRWSTGLTELLKPQRLILVYTSVLDVIVFFFVK